MKCHEKCQFAKVSQAWNCGWRWEKNYRLIKYTGVKTHWIICCCCYCIKVVFNPTWEGVQILWIGGGAKSAPPKKSMKLYRSLTYLRIELTCKKWDPNLKNWPGFWDLKFLLDRDFCLRLLHENSYNLLHFEDRRLIFWI